MGDYTRFGVYVGKPIPTMLCTNSYTTGLKVCKDGNVLPVVGFSAGNLSNNLYSNLGTTSSGFNASIAEAAGNTNMRSVLATILPPEIVGFNSQGVLQLSSSLFNSGYNAARQVNGAASNPHQGLDMKFDDFNSRSDRQFYSPINGTIRTAGNGMIEIVESGTGIVHQFLHGADTEGLNRQLKEAEKAGQVLTVEVGTVLGTMSNYNANGTLNKDMGPHVHYQMKDASGHEINLLEHWENREPPNSSYYKPINLPDNSGTVEITSGDIIIRTNGGQTVAIDLSASNVSGLYFDTSKNEFSYTIGGGVVVKINTTATEGQPGGRIIIPDGAMGEEVNFGHNGLMTYTDGSMLLATPDGRYRALEPVQDAQGNFAWKDRVMTKTQLQADPNWGADIQLPEHPINTIIPTDIPPIENNPNTPSWIGAGVEGEYRYVNYTNQVEIVNGVEYKVAANGMLVRSLGGGFSEMLDSSSGIGVIAQQSVDGLKPILPLPSGYAVALTDGGEAVFNWPKNEDGIELSLVMRSSSRFELRTTEPVEGGIYPKTVISAYELTGNNPNKLSESTTSPTPWGSETVVTDGAGNTLSTTNRQTFDDGSSLETTTTPDGKVVTKSYDEGGALAGTITDTPDGLGGMNRVVTTIVNGKEIVIDQHADADALAEDSNGDGIAGNDRGDYTTRSIKIGGQTAVNEEALAAALDDQEGTALDIINNAGSATEVELINAGDSTDSDGYSSNINTGGASSGSGSISWYDSGNIGNTTAIITSTQGLIAALKTGNKRAIAVNTFSLTASLLKDKTPEWLKEYNSVYSTLNTLNNLHDAFAKGNISGIVSSSSSLGLQVANKQLEALTQQLAKDGLTPQQIAANADVIGLKDAIYDLNVAIAVVNFFGAWNSKQYADAIMAGLSIAFPELYAAYQLAKVAYAVVDKLLGPALANILIGPLPAIMGLVNDVVGSIVGMFEDPKHPHAAAKFISDQNGRNVHAQFTDEGDYGGQRLQPILDVISQTLEGIHQDSKHKPIEGLGWLANRLPSISYRDGTYTLTITDAATGQTHTRTFDSNGGMTGGSDVTGEAANSDDFYDNIVQQFVSAALKNGASAQSWEVKTADSQFTQGTMVDDYTDQYDGDGNYTGRVKTGSHLERSNLLAGLSSEARARASGQLITNQGDANPDNPNHVAATAIQTFKPIVLDLDGNGITITQRSNGDGVLIDGDDDGFAEESDWIGTRDGILTLDRNGDGQISGGHEMFSDASVNMTARGLHALDEIDQNGDGKITSLDAVYNYLQVWTDINHDGQAQSYELSNLSKKGISELDINSGKFTITTNGTAKSQNMSVVSLNADAAGYVTQSVGNSVLVVSETDANNPKLYASASYDYGSSSNSTIRAQEPNNWGLTPTAKGAEQNTNQSAKGSDPNWLGGVRSGYGCEPMSAGLAGHDACEAKNDMTYRLAA